MRFTRMLMLTLAVQAGSALLLPVGNYAVAQPPQGASGGFDPRAMCQRHFEKMDASRDGVVDVKEFMISSEEMFKRQDLNKDGKLSKEEFCPDRPPANLDTDMGPAMR